MLHSLIEKEIDLYLTSLSWKRTTIGLRAIELSPLPNYQSKVLSLVSDENDIVRFRAIRAAINLNTYEATKALIETMALMPPMLQFPYRDALSKSPESTHRYILQYFQTTKLPQHKICCLKILSIKAGLLTEAEIEACITSDSLSFRWWGILALSNNPYEKTEALLKTAFAAPEWQLQAIAAYAIGALGFASLIDLLPPLMQSKQYWLRYTAAAALINLKKMGLQFLENAKNGENILAKNMAGYMLLLPKKELESGIRKFFPLNLDTVLLDESNTSKTP